MTTNEQLEKDKELVNWEENYKLYDDYAIPMEKWKDRERTIAQIIESDGIPIETFIKDLLVAQDRVSRAEVEKRYSNDAEIGFEVGFNVGVVACDRDPGVFDPRILTYHKSQFIKRLTQPT